MEIVKTILLVLGIISLILFIIATIVIVYDTRMTTIGRILRITEILLFPAFGPIIVLIEVLRRKEKEEN